MSLESTIKDLANIDILKEGQSEKLFIGRPYSMAYDKTNILISDYWKDNVGGIPQGAFLLAFYDNEKDVEEALLLRALGPSKLPTDNDVISSMIEYYKDNLKTSGVENQLDQFTRYEFSFSGLECRILGTFYKTKDSEGHNKIEFGADVENFFAAHNYKVYKATANVLMYISNQRDSEMPAGNENEFDIGHVRYSSSRRFQDNDSETVPVYINPKDLLGKRTALFGMTRTGKSNTVKKVIEATVQISGKAPYRLDHKFSKIQEKLEPFNFNGSPKFPVGQIIFDINGEYANPNMQDEGTAIYELFEDQVTRYSVLEKEGFEVMKVNFYTQIEAGFELICSFLNETTGDYIRSFTAVDLNAPEDTEDHSALTRYERKKAAYLCCLYAAGFEIPANFRVRFQGNADLNRIVTENGSIDPARGITLENAVTWWSAIWDNYDNDYFNRYQREHGHEWADEDLKSILIFLTRKRSAGGAANVSGYRKLRGIINLHTAASDQSFEEEIIKKLRAGRIVIVDLSQGDPVVQNLYSERICRKIFSDSMARFIENESNNFVQFYFEEAHNLFPKKDDKDLSQIYNRIAKEGAKLNLGMIYATQEVSSISGNILKNTQNWFIAHLNNDDEIKELRKYYDFSDFADALIRFSAKNDKGFVRMKTYSNPFVVPVQIKRFLAKK
jgi:DNA helicase HerA-like ATPase